MHFPESERTTSPRTGAARLRVTVLVDDPQAWIVPWAAALVDRLRLEHHAVLVHAADLIPPGDICFFLGCLRNVRSEFLPRNAVNVVVHESALPAGRGFSPVAWQVLEGCNRIPVCLVQADTEPDAGPIFLRDDIVLCGTELLPEIRHKQGEKTLELCLRFLAAWPDLTPHAQTGDPGWYRRRRREDDRLDPALPLATQFDHLRIVDNDHYPAWFECRGRRYILKIYPTESDEMPC
jgi:methionyl-tRNA formyltransferase